MGEKNIIINYKPYTQIKMWTYNIWIKAVLYTSKHLNIWLHDFFTVAMV